MLNKEILCNLFRYSNGDLIRKMPVSQNTKKGDIAGCPSGKYLRVRVNREHELVHRIVYVMFNGEAPEFLDHVDGNPLNNKIGNLRPATMAQNNWNSKKPSVNTSGVKGVHWRATRSKWFSKVDANGRTFYGGHFDSISEAEKSVKKLRELHHGEFANHG